MSNFFLNSLKYIIISGASKGFNYLLLIYLAIEGYSDQYVAILLLLSLEQLLSLLLPLNNSHIIYSKTITNYNRITNKLISSSIIVSVIYFLIFFCFKNSIYTYFGVNYLVIYISLFVSMLINAYLVYLTNYFKIIEKHNKALLIQALLTISFLFIVIFMIFLDNKILSFFLGKALGLVVIFIIVKLLNYNEFKFKFRLLNLDEFKKMINLFSISILGWISGLGFMNLAKIYTTSEELVKIGYILTICNVFLLINIGINSVYNPLIKKYLLFDDFKATLKTKNYTLLIYLTVALVSIVLYYSFVNIFSFNNNKINNILLIFPFTVLIFSLNSFQSVSQPFYMINEKFKTYNVLNILAYVIWIVLLFSCLSFGYSNFIWFLMGIHFFKALFSYSYASNTFFLKEFYK